MIHSIVIVPNAEYEVVLEASPISPQQSRKMGEAVNRLTIISLVFLPFTFFLGLFDAGFFHIIDSTTLPTNGMVIAAVTILVKCGVQPGTDKTSQDTIQII